MNAEPILLTTSRFRDTRAVRPRLVTQTWPELATELSTYRVADRKGGELWSPARYDPTNGVRANEHVQDVQTLTYDIDDGTSAAEIQKHLTPNLSYVLTSTFSHTPEHHKLRVVIELAEPIPTALFGDIWRRGQAYFMLGHADESAKDAAHMFFVAHHPPGVEPIVVVNEGLPLNWEDLPEVPEPVRRERVEVDPASIDNELERRRALGFLASWQAEISTAGSGDRHRLLLNKAIAAGGLVASGLLTESEVEDALYDASEANGEVAQYGSADVLRTLNWGLERGADRPWTPSEMGDSETWRAEPLEAKLSGAGRRNGQQRTEATSESEREGEADSVTLPAYPTFPLDVLPSPLKALVEASSIDRSLTAGAGLGVLMTAIGGAVEVFYSESQIERLEAYIPLVAPRGTGKTPAVQMLFAPLDAMILNEKRAYLEWRKVWKATPAKERKDLPKAPPLHTQRMRRVTPEALLRTMGRTPWLGVRPDELATTIAAFNAYHGPGNTTGTDLLLELWNTLDAYEYTRVGDARGEDNAVDLLIDRPTLVIVGGTQIARRSMLGQDEDGLLARWLPHVAPPVPMPRPPRRDPSEAVLGAWETLIKTLFGRREQRRRWELDDEGRDLLASYRAKWDATAAEGGLSPGAMGMIVKSDTTHLRLIGVLAEALPKEAIDNLGTASGPGIHLFKHYRVPLEVIDRAARWFWYCVQAMNVLRGGEVMGLTRQDQVLDEVCNRIAAVAEERGGRLNASEVRHNGLAGVNSARKLELVIARYKEIHPGRFEEGSSGPKGGRPARWFLAPLREDQ